MYAPPKPDYPVIEPTDLTKFDGFVFGIPTRFGNMPAQWRVCRCESYVLSWKCNSPFGLFDNSRSGMRLVHFGGKARLLGNMPLYLFPLLLQEVDKVRIYLVHARSADISHCDILQSRLLPVSCPPSYITG